ncbi:MAG: hypothetical protein NT007_03085 [Candidatus Kapabacteria bacterium]|nr:hypothetical protein [Candidatus Kapabacteria bacterium]
MLKNYIYSYLSFFIFIISIANKALALNTNSTVDYYLYVYDSETKLPLRSAKVILKKHDTRIGFAYSDAFGKVYIHNLQIDDYELNVNHSEYRDFSDIININNHHIYDSVALHPEIKSFTANEFVVEADRNIDIQQVQFKSGVQVYDKDHNNPSPDHGLISIIQENLLGAVKAPTGEIHIRGQHGEMTYYLDGIPVPLGAFGALNEIVDPKVIDRMSMMTGGFPAEYGGQQAAVMDIATKIPSEHFHLDFSTYAASYLIFNGTKPFSPGKDVYLGNSSSLNADTLGARVGPFRALNSNGQTLAFSSSHANLGYYLSATRQENDRRVDLPTHSLFNDHGTDYFLFGNLNYLASISDFLTLNVNYSLTDNQVPFDSSAGKGMQINNQSSFNAFQTVSYFHTFASNTDNEAKLFVGAYAREGNLIHTPGKDSPALNKFADDSTKSYAISENRSFFTYGIRTKYNNELTKDLGIAAGVELNTTLCNESFTSRDSSGITGPQINTKVKGSDFGLFLQSEYHILNWFRIDAGIRYDQHIAPFSHLQNQISPRLKFNFFLNDHNSFYLYYGRLFMPTNIEGLRSISNLLENNSNQTATNPEKDDFFEVSYINLFNNGLSFKAAYFFKSASPGLDDQTIGSSSIKSPVNIQNININGLEFGISYNHSKIPLSFKLNSSLIHAFGSGLISGGFLPIESVKGIDLDHDQRLSINGDLTYHPKYWFANLSFIYGSGLRNGNETAVFNPGLFDFNSAGHVHPYFIVDLSAGHSFRYGQESVIEPSIYINNVFDNNYILKGAYFSAASWGERRKVVLKLAFHL